MTSDEKVQAVAEVVRSYDVDHYHAASIATDAVAALGPLYDREMLVTVLVHHWPTRNSGCHCGWGVLGMSYPEHVADMYEVMTKHPPRRSFSAGTGAEVNTPDLHVAVLAALDVEQAQLDAIRTVYDDNPVFLGRLPKDQQLIDLRRDIAERHSPVGGGCTAGCFEIYGLASRRTLQWPCPDYLAVARATLHPDHSALIRR